MRNLIGVLFIRHHQFDEMDDEIGGTLRYMEKISLAYKMLKGKVPFRRGRRTETPVTVASRSKARIVGSNPT
jgi:hypothetical protein